MAPVAEYVADRMVVRVPGMSLVADVATFDDELLAYLMFGYIRGLVSRDGHRSWLTYRREAGRIAYVIRVAPQNDLIVASPYLTRLRVESGLGPFTLRWVLPEVITRYTGQSVILDRAYSLPARRKLERLPRAELAAYIRRFIRFKAATDGRILRGVEPIPRAPDRPQAHRLAEDIVAVADFYSIPLDFFLGIGAMENNYMNAKGDLRNTIWKRRAERGDIVLKRGKRGVLVVNDSSGIWQITRETLRYAHHLYLTDKRDYRLLPEHLRPPMELAINEVPPEALTTYAGLLFRDLLDRFEGDVTKAVGAYNGGPGNPNPRYAEGVRMVAEYARRVLEHAATLRGGPAAEMRFMAR